MPNPHNTNNYVVGKGRLEIARFNGATPGAFVDVGNCPRFEHEPTVVRLPHYVSRQYYRLRDKNPGTEVNYTVAFDLDEIAASNMRIFMMGTLIEGFKIFGLQDTDAEYALRFTSDNPTGPNYILNCHKATLSPGGSVNLIGDDWMIMSFSGEGLADILNHPESPYYTLDYTSDYVETSASESSYSEASVSV